MCRTLRTNAASADPGSRGPALPRALVAGAPPPQVFLAGRYALYRSDYWGRSWVDVAGAPPSAPVDALLVSSGDAGAVYALVSGSVWSSVDGAKTRQQRSDLLWPRRLPRWAPTRPTRNCCGWRRPQTCWSAKTGVRPVARAATPRRSCAAKRVPIAVSGDVMLVATDRGVPAAPDAGELAGGSKENLPAHLVWAFWSAHAVRAPATLYAGFAVMGYDELRARARQDEGVFVRTGVLVIAGAPALGAARTGAGRRGALPHPVAFAQPGVGGSTRADAFDRSGAAMSDAIDRVATPPRWRLALSLLISLALPALAAIIGAAIYVWRSGHAGADDFQEFNPTETSQPLIATAPDAAVWFTLAIV